jgi:hypothetical protein
MRGYYPVIYINLQLRLMTGEPTVSEALVDGPPSDGKPKMSYGVSSVTCVLPIKGWRDFACTVELDNNERFQCGYKGFEEPQLEFIRQDFRDRPGHFRLLKPGLEVG